MLTEFAGKTGLRMSPLFLFCRNRLPRGGSLLFFLVGAVGFRLLLGSLFIDGFRGFVAHGILSSFLRFRKLREIPAGNQHSQIAAHMHGKSRTSELARISRLQRF